MKIDSSDKLTISLRKKINEFKKIQSSLKNAVNKR